MTIIAQTRKAVIQALQSRGFSLVADLPWPIKFEQTARGMLRTRASR